MKSGSVAAVGHSGAAQAHMYKLLRFEEFRPLSPTMLRSTAGVVIERTPCSGARSCARSCTLCEYSECHVNTQSTQCMRGNPCSRLGVAKPRNSPWAE